MSTLIPPLGAGDHAQGSAEARATLVVYGDYECPFTRKARTVIRAAQGRATTPFRYVFRNFPLEKHPNAFRAAEAAEAAGAQGRFWDMHHRLFDSPWALEDADLVGYAKNLDLELPRFRQALETHTHAERIRADRESGLRSGVEGTPTFFINGVRYTDLEADLGTLLVLLERAADEEVRMPRHYWRCSASR